jgi:anti-sigma B factor antagonist
MPSSVPLTRPVTCAVRAPSARRTVLTVVRTRSASTGPDVGRLRRDVQVGSGSDGSDVAMECSVRVQPGTSGWVIASVCGELDESTAVSLLAWLRGLVDEHAAPLVLDLSGVPFLDSTTLGVLVSVHRRLVERGQGLVLVCPQERLLRIFRMTVLDRVFTLMSALPDAETSR